VIITGLTGGIGYGKTSFAKFLADQSTAARHLETWELVAEVATALKDDAAIHPNPADIEAINIWLYPLADIVALNVHVDISFDDIKLTPDRLTNMPEHYDKLLEYLQLVQNKPQLGSTAISDDTKEEFRPLLQWLGGYLVARAGSGVWYDEILRRTNHLRTSGCDLVTIGGVRYPSDAERLRNAGGVILEIQRPGQAEQDTQDITERERTLIDADSIIVNNGSLQDLSLVAATVFKDLSLRQLHSEYNALAMSKQLS
jgi:hypothetical protein